jgi:hypothetical protein
VHHCTLGGLYKGLDLFPNSMPGSPASFSAAFLDDGLAICCGRPQRDAMILCAVIRETQLDRDGFRLAVSQKSMGRIITSSPPDRRQTSENSRQIVGIRVAPVLSTQLANQQSHVRTSAK